MLRVGKVSGLVNDFVDDHGRDDIDRLFGVRGCVCRFQSLLSPERLASHGLAPDVHRQHLEECVRFVIPPAKSEQKRLEYSVRQSLRGDMLDICAPQLA